MNPYSIPTFFGSIFSFLLGLFVYIKNRGSKINRSFFAMCLPISLWLIAYTISYSVESIYLAGVLVRIACTAVILIPPTLYHFIVNFLDAQKEYKVVKFFYSIIFMLVPLFIFTNYFLEEPPFKYFYGYYSNAGPLHPLYLVIHFGIFFRALYLLYITIRKKHNKISLLEYNRIKYVFFACLILSIGAVDFIPKYNIEFYPFGWLFVLGCMFVISYAIIKHRLMEIEVIVKKTVVFTSLLVFVFGVFVTVAFLVGQLLGGGRLLSYFITSILIVLFHRPIETWLVNATNKYLFQKKYDYKEIIQTFIDEVITVLDLDRIINSTLDILNKTIYPQTAAIFLYNKAEDKTSFTPLLV
jgi:hypothetical protein